MKATIGGRICVGRDSSTGLFISPATARKRKKTAEVQWLRVVRLKNGRFAKQDGGR